MLVAAASEWIYLKQRWEVAYNGIHWYPAMLDKSVNQIKLAKYVSNTPGRIGWSRQCISESHYLPLYIIHYIWYDIDMKYTEYWSHMMINTLWYNFTKYFFPSEWLSANGKKLFFYWKTVSYCSFFFFFPSGGSIQTFCFSKSKTTSVL